MCGSSALYRGSPPAPQLQHGSTEKAVAPGFSLPDLSGKSVALSDFRGKVILLDFWATWCDSCREEIPQFIEMQNKYRDQGFQLIGISMDDEAQPVRDLCRSLKVNYVVLLGTAKVGELYGGVLGLPVTFLIGRDGRIDAKHIGPTNIETLEKDTVHLLATRTGR